MQIKTPLPAFVGLLLLLCNWWWRKRLVVQTVLLSHFSLSFPPSPPTELKITFCALLRSTDSSRMQIGTKRANERLPQHLIQGNVVVDMMQHRPDHGPVAARQKKKRMNDNTTFLSLFPFTLSLFFTLGNEFIYIFIFNPRVVGGWLGSEHCVLWMLKKCRTLSLHGPVFCSNTTATIHRRNPGPIEFPFNGISYVFIYIAGNTTRKEERRTNVVPCHRVRVQKRRTRRKGWSVDRVGFWIDGN